MSIYLNNLISFEHYPDPHEVLSQKSTSFYKFSQLSTLCIIIETTTLHVSNNNYKIMIMVSNNY